MISQTTLSSIKTSWRGELGASVPFRSAPLLVGLLKPEDKPLSPGQDSRRPRDWINLQTVDADLATSSDDITTVADSEGDIAIGVQPQRTVLTSVESEWKGKGDFSGVIVAEILDASAGYRSGVKRIVR